MKAVFDQTWYLAAGLAPRATQRANAPSELGL
jgi:hypothetical protein